jgi:hypothetical protein
MATKAMKTTKTLDLVKAAALQPRAESRKAKPMKVKIRFSTFFHLTSF